MIEPRCYLHKAAYIVPVSADPGLSEVIRNGAVLTENGKIKRVGLYDDLKDHEAVLADHGLAVLMPALFNCHTHLELSYLAGLGQNPPPELNIVSWIKSLLEQRQKGCTLEKMQMAAWQALALLYGGGCHGVVDIGNLPESNNLGDNFKVHIQFFLELLGLTEEKSAAALDMVSSLAHQDELAFTAHAPYSTSATLIKTLKEKARQKNRLFPIHVAESIEEVEFLKTGLGSLRDFLEERDAWDGSFAATGQSPVAYLASLGVLDEKTLCIHCVHCDDEDIAILHEHKVPVCICPGSNHFLGVGKAPVPDLLKKGVKLVLGTDSLASNPNFSLWEEMRLLSQDHPEIDPGDIIRMATLNGAKLMGLADEHGSLNPGCTARFLVVSGDLPPDADDKMLLNWLVASGLAITTEWVE